MSARSYNRLNIYSENPYSHKMVTSVQLGFVQYHYFANTCICKLVGLFSRLGCVDNWMCETGSE